MADPNKTLPGNVAGDFFVDDTCIDCDLCRQIAPASFAADRECSIVYHQPETNEQIHDARKALLTCPTGSIGTHQKPDLGEALRAYPDPIHENVFFCGYSSRNSFGGSSYLVLRREGNVLVDSPRFARQLVRRLEDMGGISKMFLSHRDDVADHEKFHAHFGCERIIHKHEASGILAERVLDGFEPLALAPDLTVIPTPGHTKGHLVLLYRQFLFTGDHLACSPNYRHPIAFRRHNWFSWSETIRSMSRLLDYTFEWILPAHGRLAHYPADTMRNRVAECVEWMKQVA